MQHLRSLLALAVPIVAGLACSALMGVVDSVLVAPLGAAALGAVSLTSSVMLVFIAALYGVLSPAGVLAAQAYGAGDMSALVRHRQAAWRLASVTGAAGALLMAGVLPALAACGQAPEVLDVIAPYWLWSAASLLPLAWLFAYKQLFDAIEQPWIGVAVLVCAVVVNAAAGVWFVGGGLGLPALGIAGAGAATFVAQATAAGLLITWGRRDARARRWLHAPDVPRVRRAWWPAATQQWHEGFPTGLQYLLETGATAAAGVLVGTFGAVALAANQVTMSVTLVLYMLPLGLAAAVGLRIGHASGAGRADQIWPLARTALVTAGAWMGLASAVLALLGAPLAEVFGADAAVAALVPALCAAVALMQVADGLQSVSLGALRGMLDSRWPTRVSIGCYWGLALPLAWLLAHPAGVGPAGIWLGFGVGLVVAAAVLVLRLHRLTAVLSDTAVADPAGSRRALPIQTDCFPVGSSMPACSRSAHGVKTH